MRTNKLILSLLTVVASWGAKGMAADASQPSLDLNDREQLKAALQMLINAGVMIPSRDGSVYKMNDADLINELRTDGTIRKGMGVETVVCIEGGAK